VFIARRPARGLRLWIVSGLPAEFRDIVTPVNPVRVGEIPL
jgi:hypothetical protein